MKKIIFYKVFCIGAAFLWTFTASAAVHWDNPKLQAIRAFLEPITGVEMSLKGDLGCEKVLLTLGHDDLANEPYYELIHFQMGMGLGDSAFATHDLYAAYYHMDRVCDLQPGKLHCKWQYPVSSGGVFNSEDVKVEYEIVKAAPDVLRSIHLKVNGGNVRVSFNKKCSI